MELMLLPAWFMNRLPGSATLRLNANILASCAAILGLVSGLGSRGLAIIPHICLFQSVLGIPCPGCGVSHSLIAAAHLQLAAAWRFNPAGAFFWFFLLFQVAARALVLWREDLAQFVQTMSRRWGNAMVACLFCVWVWRTTAFILHS